MNNKRVSLASTCRKAAVFLLLVLILWTITILRFDLFDSPPGAYSEIFITQAKPYYFEKSTIKEKAQEFGWYEESWSALPNVDKVEMAGEAEGTDLDILEVPYVCFVEIDGERLDIRSPQHMRVSQYKLYADAINQISANAWHSRINLLVAKVVVWVLLLITCVGLLVLTGRSVNKSPSTNAQFGIEP